MFVCNEKQSLSIIDGIYTQQGSWSFLVFFRTSDISIPKAISFDRTIPQDAWDTIRRDDRFGFFAGTGTTAHAVLKLNAQDGGNRRFILTEMLDYAETTTAERVRRVMAGYGDNDKVKLTASVSSFEYYTIGADLTIVSSMTGIVADAVSARASMPWRASSFIRSGARSQG